MTRPICVLVADDQEEERSRVVAPLRAVGMQIREAADGAEAIDLVNSGGVDLVLLDAYMPKVNGFLALKTIRESKRDASPPILMIIPNATDRETNLARKLGASGHVPLPVDGKALVERVRSLTGTAAAPAITAFTSRPAMTLTESRAKEDILRRIEKLPSLPSIVHELIAKVSDDSSRTADLEEIIRRDQGLSARILKVVNSSYFRGQREIRSIGDAVNRLGNNTIQSLAMASSTSGIMPVNSEAYGYRPGGLWLHSYAVASTARAAAAASTDASCAGWAYLGGLLHDVGKLIIGQMIDARSQEFARAMYESEEASDAEKRVFFHSHAEVGDMIGERWKLPDAARGIIRRHHNEIPAEGADIALMATVLANNLSKRLRFGFSNPAGPAGAPPGGGGGEADAAQPPPRPASEAELSLLRRMGLEESSLPVWEKAAAEAAGFYEVYLAG